MKEISEVTYESIESAMERI